MKIKGQKIEGPNVEIIVIPRGNGNDIVLKAAAILDFDEFYKACPVPKPPKVMKPGGATVENLNDMNYRASIVEHSEQQLAWMILRSLQATPELEWELAKLDDQNSWRYYKDELRNSGFSDVEIGRIINGVMAANGLNESKMEEARARFYAREHAGSLDESAYPTDVRAFTQLGVQQNASA